jgi:hypothetical protein
MAERAVRATIHKIDASHSVAVSQQAPVAYLIEVG